MKLKTCEFEEGEYRAPLFNQLHTSNLLWEPGQVFEKHIGIDHAMWTINAHIHSLYGHRSPLNGAYLARYNWDYIWATRKRKKKLPSFKLNLFIQAKRPHYGRYAPKDMKLLGLKSPFWRFEITPHQQVALERLSAQLKNKAIVCYACPTFHTDALLHKWTVEPKIVEKSTFPDVLELQGHTAWNYSEAGTFGVANADPARKLAAPILERISTFIERNGQDDETGPQSIVQLADAVRRSMEQGEVVSRQGAEFAEGMRDIEDIAVDLGSPDEVQSLVAYGAVLLYTYINRLNWLVMGSGG